MWQSIFLVNKSTATFKQNELQGVACDTYAFNRMAYSTVTIENSTHINSGSSCPFLSSSNSVVTISGCHIANVETNSKALFKAMRSSTWMIKDTVSEDIRYGSDDRGAFLEVMTSSTVTMGSGTRVSWSTAWHNNEKKLREFSAIYSDASTLNLEGATITGFPGHAINARSSFLKLLTSEIKNTTASHSAVNCLSCVRVDVQYSNFTNLITRNTDDEDDGAAFHI
jgi:hypothetical protein